MCSSLVPKKLVLPLIVSYLLGALQTTAFTFTSSGNESVWNLDGELFQAHQLSAQVFRGLVSLFASGPEVWYKTNAHSR